jgi:hypothetical protein
MDKLKRQGRYGKRGREHKLQKLIIEMLMKKGWFVKSTHGNLYQSGFPDLFACHSTYGHRWVEVKLPDRRGEPFTPAQIETFPKLCANGSGVWVLVAATESEYKKLFSHHNWYTYLHVFKGTGGMG